MSLATKGETLAVKYRPKTFKEVCGQSITVELLNKAIEQGKLSNAILLAGASGCGKTTCARIIANKINNGVGEPIEINASDTNGVDDVRAILESANQRALVGEYKVIIIDECHMLGGGNKTANSAWSAFLKGIEECPKYTIFIFCTTNTERMPETILNRVQRFNITPIASADIKTRLEYICQKEGFTNYTNACELISKTCHGGMRDAIAALEKCADYSTDISTENVKQVLGDSNFEIMFKLTWAVQNHSSEQILEIINHLFTTGQDVKNFISLYLDFVSDLIKYTIFKDISITAIPEYLANQTGAGGLTVMQYTIRDQFNLNYFRKLANSLLEIKRVIKYDNNYKSTIEVMLLDFAYGE